MSIYLHKHHITPRHMGGSDDPENLVEVTVEQHAALHKQLWEDLGDIRDYYAYKGLSGRLSKEEWIRLKCSLGGTIGGKKLLGRSKTPQHKEALRKSLTGYKQSDIHKKNVSEALKGEKSSCAKTYTFISPEGEEFIATGLNQFCREHKLNQGLMCEVANGQRSHHKGWKCIRHDQVQGDSL